MKGAILRYGAFVVDEVSVPRPAVGQVVVKTLTCGICGTDLHARGHMHSFMDGLRRSGTPIPTDPAKDIVFGHEFCAEILDHGPGDSKRFKPGTRIVGLPYAAGPQGMEYVGYSNYFPGGYGEQMVLTEDFLLEVPNGLAHSLAVMTEPFAVGAHAVARAELRPGAVPMVVGCGPIGLAVIATLKARGIGPVIAVDFSVARRRYATLMGADDVIDAAQETQASIWARHRISGRERQAVAFDCVGRPGVSQQIIDDLPRESVLVVVGNVLEASSIDQVVAFNKELDIRFSVNFTYAEFGQTLADIAEGRIDVRPVLTGTISPHQVNEAFADLADPDKHAKIVIDFADFGS